MTAPFIPDYDNVAGNAYDKYHSANPIARRLMAGFLASFDAMVALAGPRTAFEIGCGEGHLSQRLLANGIDISGCDLEPEIVALANRLVPGGRFTTKSIYDFSTNDITADLILCCEVLEHLPSPEAALEILSAQSASHILLSVPREPIWRALNMARGKYLSDLGNTPGHIQHWSAGGFERTISRYFEIVAIRRPLPWTMLLCRPKR